MVEDESLGHEEEEGKAGGGRGPGFEGTEEAGEASLSCCCLNTADLKSGRTTDKSHIGEFSLTVNGPIVLFVTTQITDLPSMHREIAWVI